MATSHHNASPILCASFNQDNRKAVSIVEMLFSSSLVAFVGAGEQPSLSPRRLCLFNTVTENRLRDLNFLTSILAVRVNMKRLIVLLQDKTYVYDLNSVAILDTIDTVPNAKGLCAFSPSSEGSYLALPASTERGSVLIYNTIELSSLCQIDAHRSALAALAFSSSGMFLATASEQGTRIRVHLVSQATKSYNFRRGTYPSTIYSLSFQPSVEIPNILVATSSSGSLHVFFLESLINERKPSSLLGSMIPDSLNDAFESGQHHVFHNATPVGVKSHAAIYNVDNFETTTAIRATVYIINQNGRFDECTFSVGKPNETSFSIKHNLLDEM
ncbi:hypothetical protein J5N97_026864 [Dioscorea zingiberensis]|uniref:Autophagy-related protein 18b n=1 Tax=Dioscorea zingiberensis TaxID=325984 RepID=A0A9D5C2Y0_9LILI|nr:hypothetical protein J5N97_026864 [Dioscorea zingiberensis]